MPGFVSFDLSGGLAALVLIFVLAVLVVLWRCLGRTVRPYDAADTEDLKHQHAHARRINHEAAESAIAAELNRRGWYWGDQQLDGSKPGWWPGRPAPAERKTPVVLWLLVFVAALATAICFAGSAP